MEWRLANEPISYPDAVRQMEERVARIEAGEADELLWCLEHPSLYTAGTSADPKEYPANSSSPLYQTGRGGRVTWHGPGQRVIYAMMDLRPRGRDVRGHVTRLEDWTIATLQEFGIRGEKRSDRIGIWVAGPRGDEKIAAIGVRVRRWITYHGLALNVRPDLRAFDAIVPCGLPEYGVTSMEALGSTAAMTDVDAVFQKRYSLVFGPDA